jgi:uncharacterized OB-fold protein
VTTLFEPPESDETVEFWAATREPRFVLPWCTGCEQAIWYPRLTCPRCLGESIEWRTAAGTGTVHACSIHYKAGPGRDDTEGPYVVALVDLTEGVRMMTNVIGCPPDTVTVGMPVSLAWEPLSDGRHLPMFRPA